MGRGRGKGKKITAVNSHDDPGSGGEDSIPAHKRRGRPQKPLKDDIEEDGAEKVEEEESEPVAKSKEKPPAVAENARKRKRYSQIRDNGGSHPEQNRVPGSGNEESAKPNGFRQNGSRRKSTPRRAAEAVVEWK